MKTYYAHPRSLYGSKQELRDIATIESMGMTPRNPNTDDDQAGYKEYGMDHFFGVIGECEALAFRSFFDGSISSGVSKEIKHAQSLGLPVFELPSLISRKHLSPEETRAILSELGTY